MGPKNGQNLKQENEFPWFCSKKKFHKKKKQANIFQTPCSQFLTHALRFKFVVILSI